MLRVLELPSVAVPRHQSETQTPFFLGVRRGDAETFALAHDIDPSYTSAFAVAYASGVEAIAVVSEVTLEGLKLPRAIPFHAPAEEISDI